MGFLLYSMHHGVVTAKNLHQHGLSLPKKSTVMLNGAPPLLQLIVLNIRRSALKTESLAIQLLNFSMVVKLPNTKVPELWKLSEHGSMVNFQAMMMPLLVMPNLLLQLKAKLLILTQRTSNHRLHHQNKSVSSNSLLHGADIARTWLQLGKLSAKTQKLVKSQQKLPKSIVLNITQSVKKMK